MEIERTYRKFNTKDISEIAIFTTLLVICTWINVPMLVPFTMQTFAVFLSLLILGGRKALLVVSTYILIGASGLPVFAGFRGGVFVLFGLTGGFIIGFIFQCLVYSCVTKFLGEKLYIKVVALLVGLLVCYVVGAYWFVNVYNLTISNGLEGNLSFNQAFMLYVAPYIIPDLLKLFLAIRIYSKIKTLIL
ncbi:MAG: biotin transporter BioY [bacterium]